MAAPSSVQTLQRLADKTGHQINTLEKAVRLLELLQEISQDSVLSNRLALKGGTALNVFHLSLDRLSIDIDLNHVGALDRTVMGKERPVVDLALNRLLVSRGYSIRHQPIGHAGGKWLMLYASALGGNATLELDINYMARQPLFGVARMDSSPLCKVRAKNVLVLDLHEIIAGKLVALIDRQTARDLFDARRIASISGIDWSKIKAAILAIGSCSRRDWRTMSADAIRIDQREVTRKLATCLPHARFSNKRDVDAWIEESVSICRKRFGFLFDLKANERKFLDGILDHGEINPNLLDVTPEVRNRIGNMPMLAWKSRHVRKHGGLDV